MAKKMEMPNVQLKQAQYQGALLGLAVGDALGAPLKFRARGSAPAVKDMITGGPLDVELGEWTDDTSTALCLAASLIEKNGFDAFDQLTRYNRWRREGYLSSNGAAFDMSATMKMALDKFQQTNNTAIEMVTCSDCESRNVNYCDNKRWAIAPHASTNLSHTKAQPEGRAPRRTRA